MPAERETPLQKQVQLSWFSSSACHTSDDDRREKCEVLEKAFTILTSSAVASAGDKCQSFSTFITNKLWNYLPCKQYHIRCWPEAIWFFVSCT